MTSPATPATTATPATATRLACAPPVNAADVVVLVTAVVVVPAAVDEVGAGVEVVAPPPDVGLDEADPWDEDAADEELLAEDVGDGVVNVETIPPPFTGYLESERIRGSDQPARERWCMKGSQ
jgi:hypothetical protein